AISHAAQLLSESPQLSTADARLADIIQHHSVRVNEIVESVMKISRREPPHPEYLLLAEWLDRFVEEYLLSLNRPADITVDCSYLDLLVEFDPENLRRVLGNLLDNALRHSLLAVEAERARVEVTLDFQTTQCFIDIVDEGAGVPPADRGKLFEPFFTTMESGSGMGLYLCKELCEINNAALTYAPTGPGESRFRVALNKRAL
ncbi:MAG: sensor histidine kinase, partial [Parahaliea sp.]